MKKILLIIILLIVLITLILYFLFSKKEETAFNTNFSYYKKEYHERYLNYQKKTNLDEKKVIINVNIGLDNNFYTNPKLVTNLDSNYVLVNKYNYLKDTYIPNNLVTIDEYSVGGIKLVSEVYEAFKRMAKDASLNNLNIRIVSAYRSYDYQKNLYNNYLKKDKQEVVDTYSARPGFSEHQTGLSIDIDNKLLSYDKFHYTQEFTWVKNNCYKYGFILRYPIDKEEITGYKYEPWHYRYIGIEESTYIYRHNLTYEEYYYEFID